MTWKWLSFFFFFFLLSICHELIWPQCFNMKENLRLIRFLWVHITLSAGIKLQVVFQNTEKKLWLSSYSKKPGYNKDKPGSSMRNLSSRKINKIFSKNNRLQLRSTLSKKIKSINILGNILGNPELKINFDLQDNQISYETF